VYTDNGIIIDPTPLTAKEQIDELKTVFEIDAQGDLQDYLGIQVQSKEGSLHMSQPQLIDSILQLARYSSKTQQSHVNAVKHLG
jgi:hypothetical protein